MACRHLEERFGCGIHDALLDGGWRGCINFDCLGAGPQVVQVTFGGRTWRDGDVDASAQLAAFETMRGIQEIRFLLGEPACAAYAEDVAVLEAELSSLADGSPAVLAALDLPDLRARAAKLFARVAAAHGGPSRRGAWLMAADLRATDLAGTDLLGADLRDADVRGADLSATLFLTQVQVNACRGDAATRLPVRLARPAHWVATSGG